MSFIDILDLRCAMMVPPSTRPTIIDNDKKLISLRGKQTVTINRSKMNTSNTIYNVTFGVTGHGKSHLVNLLSAPGQPPVAEGCTFSPITNQIAERNMSNGEIITDTIGFLNDSSEPGNKGDQEILKEFVDYLKGKTIRAILYLSVAVHMNLVDNNALNSLKLSGLQDHIIIVRNRCVGQGNYVENYNGIRTITIETNQSDLKMLKNMIRETPTKVINNMVVPPILFKTPIVIRERKEVKEFLREESIPIRELQSNEVQVPYTLEVADNRFQRWLGNTTTETHYRTEAITQEVMVNRPHRVFQVYEVELAERFDGALDIYTKTPTNIDQQRIG
eukprot:gene4043-4421_t